jgi:hypothetical protein
MSICFKRVVLAGLVIVLAAQPVFSQDEGENTDRAYLQYEIQKADPWGPFALNLLLGLGIGSFVQGDTTGGLLVAGGEVIGLGLFIAGYAANIQAIGETSIGEPTPNPGGGMIIAGAALLGAARIAGLVFPFTYANSFNEKLRRDLGIDVSVVPGDGLTIALDIET